LGYVALAGAAAWFWYKSTWENPFLIFTTLGVLVLGVLPTLRWLARDDATYPIMELLMFMTVPFYAMPVLTGHEEVGRFPESIVMSASMVVLTFQLACMAGAAWSARSFAARAPRHGGRWREEILPEERMEFTAYTATFNTVWLLATSFTDWIPADWIGSLRAIFTGISIISIFVQARLWGTGRLSSHHKVLFWVNLLSQVTLTLVSLLLINAIGLLFTAFVGYFTTARRVPWVPVLLILPVLAVLHNGKSTMREIYWADRHPAPQFSDLPDYFLHWAELGLANEKTQTQVGESQTITYGLLRRASLFQIVCVTVDTIPRRNDFLYGASYQSVPAQLIPRFLWPDKPSPHQSVKLMSVQLGLLTEEGAENTSIGFGMITEAYANFGYVCVALLGLVLGSVFRWLSLTTADCPTFSFAGLMRILCLVWCINAETTLAVWLSSLYQACVAIFLTVLVLRSLFGGQTGPQNAD
jgi:hypothetical protein